MQRLSILKVWAVVAMLLILFGPMTLLAAQNQKNKKNAKDVQEPEAAGISSVVPLTEAQTIELMISQMLAAWQVGDDRDAAHVLCR